jgi:hypothetical protein
MSCHSRGGLKTASCRRTLLSRNGNSVSTFVDGGSEGVRSLRSILWTRFTSESRAYIVRLSLQCRIFSFVYFFSYSKFAYIYVAWVPTKYFSVIVYVCTATPATELSRHNHKTPPQEIALKSANLFYCATLFPPVPSTFSKHAPCNCRGDTQRRVRLRPRGIS